MNNAVLHEMMRPYDVLPREWTEIAVGPKTSAGLEDVSIVSKYIYIWLPIVWMRDG